MEQDTLKLRVECADGQMPQAIAWSALPEGAASDPETHTLTWTPALDQAGEYTVGATLGEDTSQVLIQVVDRFDHPDNAPLRDPRAYRTEHGLPVIHMGLSMPPNDDTYVPATITHAGREYNTAAVKYRGATSRKYNKRSYTVKLDKADRFEAQQPGFEAPRRRIVLTTTFDDNSNLRQRLAYALWNSLDPAHIQVASFNAVLYIDGVYKGIYLVSDHIDDDLLEAHGMDRDANLYKARGHSANFRDVDRKGKRKSSWHAGYTKEEGSPEADQPGAYDDLDQLVQWAAEAEPDAFAAELGLQTRRADFEGWFLLISLIAANDSAGKNSYLARDPAAPALGWRLIPWDFNASFGQNYQTQRRKASQYPPDHYAGYNRIFELFCNVPQLRAAVAERYQLALSDAWQLDTVLAWLDDWAEEIRDASLRDEQKWSAAQRAYNWGGRTDFSSHEQEIAYLRAWIRDRWERHSTWQ